MTTEREIAMPERTILLNPGPVVIDRRVRDALALPDMCHREPEFSELMTRVRDKLTLVCGGDISYTSVVFTGSGTAALEATISSVVPDSGKLLILSNGHYGERLQKIARIHKLNHATIDAGWAAPLELSKIDAYLRDHNDVTLIAMVHHETSTGMLNPVHQVGEVASRYGCSLIVDAISSLAGEILDIRGDSIDWCVGTANKCIEGVPGVSFVCAPRKKLDELASIPARTMYLSIYSQYAAEDRDKAPPFTPAVQTFFALDTALDLLLDEGVGARCKRYRNLALQARAGLEKIGLRLLLPPELRSNTLTAIYLPPGMDYRTLHDELRRFGFVIYAGQDTLKQKAFRIANMGQITTAEMDAFLSAMEQTLAKSSAARVQSR
ncbi:MAG: 2-aminoethylphosphonate aminotransferase [Acidobacteriota bacterium]|nr:2-aminoethylphosphonate aminotransferase [Acidobacteriota bacterium]